MRYCYLAFAALLACRAVIAATPESITAEVERIARAHLDDLVKTAGLPESSVELTVLQREAVKPCTANARIEAIDTRSVTRMRFAVFCDNPSWRHDFIVRGSITARVVTAARDVRAGDMIPAEALKLERREVAAPEDALTDIKLVEGRATRRVLRQGQVVSRRGLIEPVLVRRGANVTIVARNTGVAVQVAGEALEAGRRDEVVRIRNKTNGSVIRARVIDENEVEPVISTDPAAGR